MPQNLLCHVKTNNTVHAPPTDLTLNNWGKSFQALTLTSYIIDY